MFYNVLKLKDLGKTDKSFEKEILMEHDDSCLSIVSIKKDEIIDTHTSKCNTAVIVIDGEIELHFDAEKFKIEKGEMLMFKKEEQHKVVAQKDSRFLLSKSKRNHCKGLNSPYFILYSKILFLQILK